MELTYMELREEICDICHKMWQLGWVAANDGNVSAKLPDGTFLATPTGISKSFITPEKLVRIDSTGKVLEALEGYKPSSLPSSLSSQMPFPILRTFTSFHPYFQRCTYT